jgi:SAM-dependent MidA family methyltransferase
MPAATGKNASPLLDTIRSEIERGGAMSFARFMELALYDPEHGYYARGAERLGREGDFFTASDAGRGFGRSMARQIQEIDQLAGAEDPFHVVEFGAGRGLLARDVLDALQEIDSALFERTHYLMVDRSASMRTASAACEPRARAVAPDELEGGLQGCVLAVELFDALPVHRLRRRGGELVEIRVDLNDSGALVERESAPDLDAASFASRYGAAEAEGSEAEVALGLAALLDRMQRVLERGVLILVDYGYPATELYGPERIRGTLLAYHGHATNERYLERVGEQDLTAHVNFTALEDCARDLGLSVLGLTTQDRFLVANGILDYFAQREREESYDPRRVKERLQAMQLIHPLGMGRTFKVLMLAKGWMRSPHLSGMRDPFRSDR